jgi:LacI family transcriptional regulator
MTVSRALRGSAHVSQDTRARINAEVERLGYQPSFSARSLRTGQSRIISFLAPNLMIPLHIEVIQGARDAAAQAGYRLLLQVDASKNPGDSPFVTDGTLIIDYFDGPLQEPGRTVVLMGQADDVDCCGTDLPGVARDTFHYLHSVGYRRVGLIQATGNHARRGMEQARAQLGMEPAPDLLQEVGFDRDSIIAGVRTLTSLTPKVDAIVVIHTAGTPVALDELQRQGLVIGRDIGFVGTEVSHSEWGNVVSPKMTSVRIPGYAIGWAGAVKLIDRLNGDESEPITVNIPSELVIKQSTPSRHAG